jgi:hypothetical protein
MRTTWLVVVMLVVGGLGCFSTARYDDAHMQRVASINARYEAETAQEQEREHELASVIDRYRALLVPIKPGSLSTPMSHVSERAEIIECRTRCDRRSIDESLDGRHTNDRVKAQCLRDVCEPAYLDALTKTYSGADVRRVTSQRAISEGGELESRLAGAHNRVILQHIEDESRELARLQEQTRRRLEQDRREAIAASAQRRDAEIASGRAVHRARIRAAAFAARDPGPVAAGAPPACVAAEHEQVHGDGCRAELPSPDLGSSAETNPAPVGAP